LIIGVNVNADDYMTLSSGRLLIGAVRSRDAGRYRCSGYNDVIGARAWSPAAYRLHVVDGRSKTIHVHVVLRRHWLMFLYSLFSLTDCAFFTLFAHSVTIVLVKCRVAFA